MFCMFIHYTRIYRTPCIESTLLMECQDGAPGLPGVGGFCDLVGSRTHKPYMLSIIGIGISVVLLETGMDFSIGDWAVLLMFERKTYDYIYIGVIGYCLSLCYHKQYLNLFYYLHYTH